MTDQNLLVPTGKDNSGVFKAEKIKLKHETIKKKKKKPVSLTRLLWLLFFILTDRTITPSVCEGGGSDPPGSVRWELSTGSAGSGTAGVAEFRLGPRRFPFLSFFLLLIPSAPRLFVWTEAARARFEADALSLRERARSHRRRRGPVHLSKYRESDSDAQRPEWKWQQVWIKSFI